MGIEPTLTRCKASGLTARPAGPRICSASSSASPRASSCSTRDYEATSIRLSAGWTYSPDDPLARLSGRPEHVHHVLTFRSLTSISLLEGTVAMVEYMREVWLYGIWQHVTPSLAGWLLRSFSVEPLADLASLPAGNTLGAPALSTNVQPPRPESSAPIAVPTTIPAGPLGSHGSSASSVLMISVFGWTSCLHELSSATSILTVSEAPASQQGNQSLDVLRHAE